MSSVQSIYIALLIKWAGLIGFAICLLLLLRYLCKLKWLTSICISLLPILILFFIMTRTRGFHIGFAYVPGGVPLVLAILIIVTILIVMFVKWLFTQASSQSSVNPAERNRILKMVEDGKMTSDEAKELLDALGKSSALRGEEKFSHMDILMLASVALVILGFFLPWVYIRIGYQAGYQTGAIGWTLFIIAISSAIPVFITPRNFLYKISMLQIFLTIIGATLAISLMIRAGENMGAGILLCLIGFILALTASATKLKSLAA